MASVIERLRKDVETCADILVRNCTPEDNQLAFSLSAVLDGLTKRLHIGVALDPVLENTQGAIATFDSIGDKLQALKEYGDVAELLDKIESRKTSMISAEDEINKTQRWRFGA